MGVPRTSQALLHFIEDEMLRAPLLFDLVVDGALEHARNGLPGMSPAQRAAVGDLMLALAKHRVRQSEYFIKSLTDQVSAELEGRALPSPLVHREPRPDTLSLVDEEEVAIDVELSHTIEAIKSVAEFELRELQTYVSALVGDMEMARDHNPFRAETFARALWAAAQALPVTRGLQVGFMRHASAAMAQLLRKTYAASTSRLEAAGIEPAAYRTLILPAGSRRGRRNDSTFVPDLQRIRDSMPAPLDTSVAASLRGAPLASAAPSRSVPAVTATTPSIPARPGQREHWSDIARLTPHRADRQAIELVSRLFDAMQADERVPQDVALLISHLHGPAMRLALRDPALLEQNEHALWRLINRLVFMAEMSPDPTDPERRQLLKMALAAVDQVAAEPQQSSSLYQWALERVQAYLDKRLARRLATVTSQTGALQKLEATLLEDLGVPSTMHGTLDVPQLDTVPAELMQEPVDHNRVEDEAARWLQRLQTGAWLRLFLQGRWVRVQLLWHSERDEIWLLGDGASDTTWAVRRGALLTLRSRGLMKTLRERSLVAGAATRVQHQVSANAGAATASAKGRGPATAA